jgi:hypothetical protein
VSRLWAWQVEVVREREKKDNGIEWYLGDVPGTKIKFGHFWECGKMWRAGCRHCFACDMTDREERLEGEILYCG